MFRVSSFMRGVIGVVFFCDITKSALAQAYEPTPTPNTVCSTLQFGRGNLASLGPLEATVSGPIYSKNSGDSHQIVGTYLSSNFGPMSCLDYPLSPLRGAILCHSANGILVKKSRSINLKKIVIRGPKEDFMLLAAGPLVNSEYSAYTVGSLYYLKKGKIFALSVSNRQRPTLKFSRFGTYVGSCDDRVR